MMQGNWWRLGFGVGLAAVLAGCMIEVDEESVGTETLAVASEQPCVVGATPCPTGYECVDDPTDECNTALAGAGCGVCERIDPGKAHCERGAGIHYVSYELATCAKIRMFCPEGRPFFNDCGCGCREPKHELKKQLKDELKEDRKGEPCGDAVCVEGEYCCNESCGWCVPLDVACIAVSCG